MCVRGRGYPGGVKSMREGEGAEPLRPKLSCYDCVHGEVCLLYKTLHTWHHPEFAPFLPAFLHGDEGAAARLPLICACVQPNKESEKYTKEEPIQ